jgi:quercetin dioxygenase-like cupin family protein
MAESQRLDPDLPEGVEIVRWPHARPLPEEEIVRFFQARKQLFSRWSNGPNEVYSLHTHPYRKILFCVQGGITFTLPDLGESLELGPGDRLILRPGVRHGALVGPEGVTCIEAGE